jgi:hypothetical protein
MLKHGRTTDAVKQELSEHIITRNKKGEIYCEKWMKNTVGGKDLQSLAMNNPSKARNVAMALQMQEAYLQTLSESVISTNFSVRPENLLKAVKIGVANSNRGEIFTEYPLQTTDDAIFYIWMTYESSLRGSTAGQRIYENINQFYAGEQAISSTLATGNGVTKNFTLAAVSPLNLIPRTVNLIVGGAIVAKDDGAQNFVDFSYTGQPAVLDSTAANTISYTTGIAVLNFAVAPANGAPVALMYNYDSENLTNFTNNIGTVGITLDKKRFNARPMPLGYSYSLMTQIVLDTTGIGNAEELLMSTVGDEHAKSRDYKAIQRARQVALGNPIATFNADFAAVGEISLKSHAQNILKAINEVGAAIYDDIKRGMINKVVAGSKVLPFLKLHDLWVDDMAQPRSGIYKAGRLSDIDVYVCPAATDILNSNEMLLTYKNPQEGMDLTIVFGVLTEIDAALKYPEFYTKGYKATVEDSIVVNTKFCRLMQVTNLNTAA